MKIVCIGSGNVATHMAQAFKANGANLIQIWSKNLQHAEQLASITAAQAISDLSKVDRTADLYIIAVKDDAIAVIAAELAGLKGLVVHTSGATAISALSASMNYGVLYPLQTFSKSKSIDFSHVPLCIEANDKASLVTLKNIALSLSRLVYEVSSEQRSILHLAAVFACNFTNHLYTLSNQILEEHDLDFEILRPLIMETAVKVQTELPEQAQTGPAIRSDEQTMMRHLELLQHMPELKEIYKTLSKSIKKTHS